ncbi:MAG TPA: D-alanyl-D-alanine carboxypeptidase [Gammaproteobacteria bacterium]|nr:D-alanyl-D-alanine carboxypeptidase [Gammaproteobacteria bacterium]
MSREIARYSKGIVLLAWLTFITAVVHAEAIVPSPPSLAAKSYVLMDFASRRFIVEHNPNLRSDPASLTKIMTAYVVFNELKNGNIRLDDKVHISEKAWRMEGSRMFVEVDKEVPVADLIKGMVIQSGNDASVALAEHVAGSEEAFASLMNKHARRLGMNDTHFVNATGLPDKEHYTTAHDLALLTRALIEEFPDHYKLNSQKKFHYNGITQYNRNKLLWRDPAVDGVKTGHTEAAGYCLVASAKRDDMRLISVVMNTASEKARAAESQKLLRYGFRFFSSHRLYAANEPLTRLPVWKGESAEVAVGLEQPLHVLIPRGQYDNLKATMNVDETIVAPVEKGREFGTVSVTLNGKQIAQQPLISLESVAEGGLFTRLRDSVLLLVR